MAKDRLPFLSDKEINIIRGKAMVGHASPKELLSVFAHLDSIEYELDQLDMEDFFGTEGWRHAMSIPGAD